jgi:hypothetical protein
MIITIIHANKVRKSSKSMKKRNENCKESTKIIIKKSTESQRKVQNHKEKREKLNERDGEYINHGIIR